MLKQDISQINWKALVPDTDPKLVKDTLGIPASAEWVLPQLMAFLASQVKLKRNTNNKFGFKPTLFALLGQVDESKVVFGDGTPLDKRTLKGMLDFLKIAPRGSILPQGAKQCTPKWARYATGVPLFLSAFKEYRDVQYSEWDWDDEPAYINAVLERDWLNISQYFGSDVVSQLWSPETLIEYTKIAAVVKSGKTEGKVRTLNEITTFSSVGDNDFDALKDPRWLRPLICQTWVFQPHIASKYAITNLQDIDTPALAIRGDLELFKQKPQDLEIWGDL